MNLFQTLALLVVALLLVVTVLSTIRGWATKKEGTVWALVWLTTGTAIAWPKVTSVVARALGIGRGADLVLYCSVVVMLVGFLMTYTRLCRVRRELTLLVRHLAIRDAVSTSSTAKPDETTSADKPHV